MTLGPHVDRNRNAGQAYTPRAVPKGHLPD